jgi:preprotein translocase subunit SecG
MTTLFVILIILAAIILALIVLIQNPKGGGLAGNFAGVSSQFMGVKQTNDVLERGTWIFAAAIGVLSLLATFFISGSKNAKTILPELGTAPVQQAAPPAANPLSNPNTVPIQQAAPAATTPQKGSTK